MADIVLVHGIAQEQRSADDLEQEWLPSLAGGLRTPAITTSPTTSKARPG